MKVITVVSDTTGMGFNLLKLSCALNDLHFVALGYPDDRFTGNRIKDHVLNEYLCGLSDHEVVLFTDCYDSLMLADEDEILNKFYASGAELLFSAESNCWPDKNLAEHYPEAGSRYRYLNSGGFIGRVGVIRDMLSVKLDDFSGNFQFSNQYLWTIRFFQFGKLIRLDTGCNLFCTFSPEIGEDTLQEEDEGSYAVYRRNKRDWFKENFIIKEGRIFNKISGTWPSNVHFNGKSKCLINSYIIDMIFSKIPGSQKSVFQFYGESITSLQLAEKCVDG